MAVEVQRTERGPLDLRRLEEGPAACARAEMQPAATTAGSEQPLGSGTQNSYIKKTRPGVALRDDASGGMNCRQQGSLSGWPAITW